MTDLPIQKVLQKPDVFGRMVRGAVELSEFDIVTSPEDTSRDKSTQTSSQSYHRGASPRKWIWVHSGCFQ